MKSRNIKQLILSVSILLFLVYIFLPQREYWVDKNSSKVEKTSLVSAVRKDSIDSSNSTELLVKHAKTNQQINKSGKNIQTQDNKSHGLTCYLSGQQSGIIGVYGDKLSDNPADNVFTVSIDRPLQTTDKVWLNYKLTGVDHSSGIACSVNDRLSFGGYLVKTDTATHRQRVQLNPKWLLKGENQIRFGLPENASYGYKISELAIEVEQSADIFDHLIVDAGRTLYDGKAYVHGFIRDGKNMSMRIGGKTIKIRNGEFEAITTPKADSVIIDAQVDGKAYTKVLKYSQKINANYSFKQETDIDETNKFFTRNKTGQMGTEIAILKTPAKTLLSNRRLSATDLRNIDLPALDLGMTNVTSSSKGVRFLPHGEHFSSNGATIALKYDKTRIPDGYTENDIRTYYFDTNTKHWVALERDTVDKTLCMVVSKTTHFTDMINGVIKAPESPETQGFAPTMMNDIKAADPTSKIQLIAPPSANNQGSANLSYSLEMPPARNGMSPQLAIQYNSDGSSGWLGEGWDLNVPMISVDTRWGVPRYDPKYETETYLMNGMMLATIVNNNSENGLISVAHRGTMYERLTGPVQFHPVTESDFSKITRVGNGPGSYIWIVETKTGIKYTYGQPENNAILNGTVTTFEDGVSKKELKSKNVIAEWKLSRVEDQYRNFCKYTYVTSTTFLDASSKVPSKEIKLSKIEIGKVGTDEVGVERDNIEQTVFFTADSKKSVEKSNARYGFVSQNNSLLDKIDIKFGSTLLRSYKFQYTTGLFSTKLLESVKHIDNKGKEIAKHNFQYYNNALENNNVKLFSSQEKLINTGKSIEGLPALGGGSSKSISGSLYLGVGVGIGKVGIDAGYNFSLSSNTSNNKMLMIDINGDGLPDKVFKEKIGSQTYLFFIPNLGNSEFGNTPINTYFTGDLSFTESTSYTNGWKGNINAYGLVGVNAGMDWSNTTSTTKAYLNDVNNDGLVDIVNNNKVYFNKISSINNLGIAIPQFTTNSGETPNPIMAVKTLKKKTQAIVVSDNIVQQPTANSSIQHISQNTSETEDVLQVSDEPIQRSPDSILVERRMEYENKPMQDIVRVWEAPYSGNIEINSKLKLIETNNNATSDGVRVAIQYKGNEIWTNQISPTDFTEKVTQNNINVTAGEKIYFRLQSGSEEFCDGVNDIVYWSPIIKYTDRDQNVIDENGYNDAIYNTNESSFVSKIGYNLIDSVNTSTVTVKGRFIKPVTSNSIQLKVYLTNDSLFSRDSLSYNIVHNDITNNYDTISQKFTIHYYNNNYHPNELVKTVVFDSNDTYNDELSFNIKSLVGTNHYRFEISSGSNVCWDKIKWSPEIHCSMGVSRVDTIIFAGVKYDVFTNGNKDKKYFKYPENNDSDFTPINGLYSSLNANIRTELDLNCNRILNTDFQLTIKSKTTNINYRFSGQIINNVPYLQSNQNDVYIDVPYDDISVDMFINDTIQSDKIAASIVFNNNEQFDVRVYCKRNIYNNHNFGHLWRGWGQFEYNAANGRFAKPIVQDKLYLPSDTSQYALKNEWGIKNMHMFTLNPEPKTKSYWAGLNEQLFIIGDTLCTGRLNIMEMPDLASYSNAGGPSRVPRFVELNNNTNEGVQSNITTSAQVPMQTTSSGSLLSGSNYGISNAPLLSTKYSSESWWGGASVNMGVIDLGQSRSGSTGRSKITSAFMDMNGDGYPDYVTETQIEYTNSRGGRDREISNVFKQETNESNSTSSGFSGGYTHSLSSKGYGISIELPSDEGTKLYGMNLSKDTKASVSGSFSRSRNTSESTNAYIDINGDGLPDRIYKEGSIVKYCLNLGYGFSDPIQLGLNTVSWTISDAKAIGIGGGIDYSKTTEIFTKLLSDNASKTINSVVKKLKFGVGVGINGSFSDSYTFFGLRDVNMDGLPDKLYKSTSNQVAIALNTGKEFTDLITESELTEINKSVSNSGSVNVSLSFSINIAWFKIAIGGSANFGWGSDYTIQDLVDIDADGYADAVKANDKSEKLSELKVKYSRIGYSNKLKSVTNPLGGIFTLDYSRNKATFDHPGGKWVMKSVEVNDGVSDDGDNIETSFEYSSGKYDRYEREFLGFAEVTTNNMYSDNSVKKKYRSLKQKFATTNCYQKGLLVSTEVLDLTQTSPRKYSESSNKYYNYSVTRVASTSSVNKGKYKLSAVELTDYKMFLNQYIVYTPARYSTNLIYAESQALATSTTYSEYNTEPGTHGELKLFKFSDKGGLVENGTGPYNYRTEIEYLTDRPSMTLFCLPKKVTVTGFNEVIYRKVEADWYDNFATQIKWVKNHITDDQVATTDIEYDTYGNILKKTLPANYKNERMSYTYEYDQVYHMYPTKITDAFGYTTELLDYDEHYGVPRKTIDINGNIMTTTLDNLGRVESITGPKEYVAGAPSQQYTIQFDYHPSPKNDNGETQKPYAITRHNDATSTGDNSLETVTFVDGFGRAIQVKKESVIDGDKHVMLVSGRAIYDAFGRVKASYYPVVENFDNTLNYKFNPTFDSVESKIPSTRTAYDIMDRIVLTKLPDGTSTSMTYGIEDGLLKTTIQDALKNTQTTYTNGSGQTVKTLQKDDDNKSIITQFEYDNINQLTTVTDAMGKQTKSIYDMAGRRTQVTHPASGITIFEYDNAGNLTARQTANLKKEGKKINYAYTYNRLDAISYPNHPENDVKYIYGSANETGEGNNYRAGRLKYLEDGSGTQEFKYGKQGELTEVTRTLVIPNQTMATYVTKWNYDSWNRLQTMTYPDGEKVKYKYNEGGLLTSVIGEKGEGKFYNYVDIIKYDKFEQRSYLKYGNGAETNYDYDATSRQLHNLRVTANLTDLMNNTYEYDDVSNVTGIKNTGSAVNTTTGTIGGTMEHNYVYDKLYRLKGASGDFNKGKTKTSHYDLQLDYDDLHNITSKKQEITQTNVQFAGTLRAGYNLSYTYADNSQQISNIVDENYRVEGESTPKNYNTDDHIYSYDANGNLISVNTGRYNSTGTQLNATNTRKLLWDEENRLLSLADNGFVSNYFYDAAGERTVKMSGDAEGVYVNGVLSAGRTGTSKFTAYISPYTVISNGGQMSKHIYIGTQRIVSKLIDGGTIANPTTVDKATYTGNSLDYSDKYATLTANIKNRYDELGITYRGTDNAGAGYYTATTAPDRENLQYFYHSDHLGSSSLITDVNGALVQHIEYVPFGEVFVEERNNSWSTPYKFNGKEQDEETGLHYYGARYYDSRTSVWLSVDPMAEKFAGRSSYEFSLSNPIKFIDFNGMDPTEDEAKAISSHVYGDQKDNTLIGGWKLKERYKETDNGMKSALYVRMSEDKKTELEYCYATAGTEPSDLKRDGKADVLQTIGLSNQFKESISKAKELRNTYGDKLSFTGHSLGGALASANALATGGNAQSYNSAWLSVATKLRFGLNNKNGQIDAYINVTDYVTWGQILLKGLINPEGNIHLRIPANINSWGHSINNDMKPIDIKERIMGVMDAINQRANPANYIKGF